MEDRKIVWRDARSEEGVLLFTLPHREPKEDGGRNAADYQ